MATGKKPSYKELLDRPEWRAKRKEILDRDKNTCQSCGYCKDRNPYLYLNVHHLYYEKGLLPWQYPNGALITWCEKCHSRRHIHMDIITPLIGLLSLYQFDMLVEMIHNEINEIDPRKLWETKRRVDSELASVGDILKMLKAEGIKGITFHREVK